VTVPQLLASTYQSNYKVFLCSACEDEVVASTALLILREKDLPIFFIDDLGNAKGYEAADAAGLHYGHSGEVVAEKRLLHGTYRIRVNPLGRGLIAMSKDCVLHAYDDDLNMILETPLREVPQITEVQRRRQIGDSELKKPYPICGPLQK